MIAGSDSGGGAGIQADIKAIMANGAYAATAITALTAQNTLGVHGIMEVPPDFIVKQIEVVLSDIGADVIKTGMLHNAEVIEAVAASIKQIPLVLDPVMVAKGGASLLQESAVAALKAKLLPLAFVVTPNIPEAEVLTGVKINNIADATKAAKTLLDMGAKNALVKGGHMDGDEIIDVLAMPGSVVELCYKRIDTRHTHGTGCTMASAIAANIARGLDINSAVAAAGRYVQAAIANAPQLGRGHGPLNHRALL